MFAVLSGELHIVPKCLGVGCRGGSWSLGPSRKYIHTLYIYTSITQYFHDFSVLCQPLLLNNISNISSSTFAQPALSIILCISTASHNTIILCISPISLSTDHCRTKPFLVQFYNLINIAHKHKNWTLHINIVQFDKHCRSRYLAHKLWRARTQRRVDQNLID